MSSCENPQNKGNIYSADFVLALGTVIVPKNDARMANFNNCSNFCLNVYTLLFFTSVFITLNFTCFSHNWIILNFNLSPR